MRTFLAVDLSAEAKQQIERLQMPFGKIRGIKTTRPEQCHLTLKFLGEIDEKQQAEFVASLSRIRQASFQLSLTKLGAFPDAKHPKVIFLGVSDSAPLAALAQAVDRATNAIALDKPFAPHITIARVKEARVKIDPALLEVRAPPCTIAVTEFVLYKSVFTAAGSKYEILRRFEFVG